MRVSVGVVDREAPDVTMSERREISALLVLAARQSPYASVLAESIRRDYGEVERARWGTPPLVG